MLWSETWHERWGEPSDSCEAVLFELREQRAWARVVRLLESMGLSVVVHMVEQVAKRAAAADDRTTLSALSTELPDFLTSRDVGIVTATALTIVEAAERPLLFPEQRKARAIGEELKASWHQVLMAFDRARSEMEGECSHATTLPRWDRGSATAIQMPSTKIVI